MRTRIALNVAVLALFIAAGLPAQQKGGGAKGGGAGQAGPQVGGSASGKGTQGPQAQGKGVQDRDLLRVHTTSQQRDQLRTCDQSADRLRKQAAEMVKLTQRSQVRDRDLTRAHEQLQQRVRDMDRQHQQLMSGLNGEQQMQWADRVREMTQARERVTARLQQMDASIVSPQQNRVQIQEQAREMEQAMTQWREHYRAMRTEAIQ